METLDNPVTNPAKSAQGTLLFVTPRLACRQLTAADEDELYAVYSDPEAMKYVDDGQPISREETRQWIEVTQANYARRGYGMSALELKESGEIVGFMGLVHPKDQVEPELKYALKRAFWGQGLATEAADGMLRFGLTSKGMRYVIATTAPANAPSHRVLEKVGMQRGEIVRDDGEDVLVFEWRPRPLGWLADSGEL